jgi:hypothetical protein
VFIAFEGPDNTGKSTSAANLAHDGKAIYNATKKQHEAEPQPEETLVVTYDRIDWFTHMVYRLSLPERDWNDERPRTVFAMPDTHLVIKLHHPDLAQLISDELYSTGTLARVNPMYYYFADFFMGLNEERDYALFRTVSIMEVSNDPRDGSFSQRLVSFSSPAITWEEGLSEQVTSDESLLELLRNEEQQRA